MTSPDLQATLKLGRRPLHPPPPVFEFAGLEQWRVQRPATLPTDLHNQEPLLDNDRHSDHMHSDLHTAVPSDDTDTLSMHAMELDEGDISVAEELGSQGSRHDDDDQALTHVTTAPAKPAKNKAVMLQRKEGIKRLGHPQASQFAPGRTARTLHRSAFSSLLARQNQLFYELLRSGHGGIPQNEETAKKNETRLAVFFGFCVLEKNMNPAAVDFSVFITRPDFMTEFLDFGQSCRGWSNGTVATYLSMFISIYNILKHKHADLCPSVNGSSPGGADDPFFFVLYKTVGFYDSHLKQLKSLRTLKARPRKGMTERQVLDLVRESTGRGVALGDTELSKEDLNRVLAEKIDEVNTTTGEANVLALRDLSAMLMYTGAAPPRGELYTSVYVDDVADESGDERIEILIKEKQNFCFRTYNGDWMFVWCTYKGSKSKGIEPVPYTAKDHPLLTNALDRYVSGRHILADDGTDRLFVNGRGEPYADVASWSGYISNIYYKGTGRRGISINTIRSIMTTDFRLSEESNDPATFKGFLEAMRHSEVVAERYYDKRTKAQKIGAANKVIAARTMQSLQSNPQARAALLEFGHDVTLSNSLPPTANNTTPVTRRAGTQGTVFHGAGQNALSAGPVPRDGDVVFMRKLPAGTGLGGPPCENAKGAASGFCKVIQPVTDPTCVTLARLKLVNENNVEGVGAQYTMDSGSAFLAPSSSLVFPVDCTFDPATRSYNIYESMRAMQKLSVP